MNTIIHNAKFYREEVETLSRLLAGDLLTESQRPQFQKQLESAQRHLADAEPKATQGDHERLSDVLEIETRNGHTVRVTKETDDALFASWHIWCLAQADGIGTPQHWGYVLDLASLHLKSRPDTANETAQDVRAIMSVDEINAARAEALQAGRLARYRQLVDTKYLNGLTMAEAEEMAELSAQIDKDMTPEHLKTPEAKARLAAEQARYEAAMNGLGHAITLAFADPTTVITTEGRTDYDTTHQIKALIGATSRLRSSILSLLTGK